MSNVHTPLAAIVVLNYNCHNETIECVRAVQRCGRKDLKLIVVDNCSTDGSYDALKSAFCQDDDVELIMALRNGGFSEGSNIGMVLGLALEARWIHLLNPDTEVAPDFYDRLSVIDSECPDVHVVGGLGLFMSDRDRIWFGGGDFDWFKARGVCRYQGEMLERRPAHGISGPSEFLTCACLMLRREVVQKVGVLDNRYFLGGEEWDYSRRLGRAGYKLQVDGKLKYWHHVSASLEQKVSLKYIYNGYRTKLLFIKDQKPLFYYLWRFPYFLYSRVIARRQFRILNQSLAWADILAAIKLAEHDDRRYRSIELDHLAQFT